MFKRPGKKLKTLAKVLFVLLVIIPVLLGLVLIFGAGFIPEEITQSAGIQPGISTIIAGILVILIGFLNAWLHTILLYTIGEISDDLEIMRRATVMIYHQLEEDKVEEPKQVKDAVQDVLSNISDLDELDD